MVVAKTCRFFDTWVVDMFYDTLAAVTERFAAFTGKVLDAQFVDGLFNGIAQSSMDLAGVSQRPQTGRIRNYVLFAVGVAAIAVVCLVYFGTSGRPASAVALSGG